MTTFRSVLRENTRPEHDRLDKVFSSVDIAERDGLKRFICVHEACFRYMSEHSASGSYSHQTLLDMVRRLALDRDVLGARPLHHHMPVPTPLDPLAIDYLVAGSRLGSKVLRKRWSSSNDLTVLRANNYFEATVDPTFWQTTCDALTQIQPDSAHASAIERDSRFLFNLFLTVCKRTAATEVLAQ